MIMKIVGLENEVNFDENGIYVLEVENLQLFSSLVLKIYNLSENIGDSDQIKLFDNGEEILFHKNVFFCSNIFACCLSTKNIMTKLYSMIEKQINIDFDLKRQYQDKTCDIITFVMNNLKDISIDFKWNNELPLSNFLKAINFEIDVNPEQSFVQRMLTLVDIISELQLYKIIVFVNLRSFLSIEEISEVYKYSLYRNICILNLESQIRSDVLPYEIKIIIENNYNEYMIKHH